MTLTARTDIYTTNKLLGHTSVHTTEIYADVVMETKFAEQKKAKLPNESNPNYRK